MNFLKISSTLVLLLILALFFGCNQQSFCGDQLCTAGEENTCPTDCAKPVNATVNVYVSGGYDAQGDISLYWYHSKDVSLNAYQNITSRLGEHWFGEDSKNLYVSFNQSQQGERPLGNDRQVSMNFTEPGDYYFEVRSDDYSYRAVSEKITITASDTYNVNLNMVPSNPAVRVRAYDESGSTLYGDGTITLTTVESDCSYGECNDNEWTYDSRHFYSGEEMNALFFVYVPYNDYLKNESKKVYYKIKVERAGYVTQTLYYWPYDKYSDYGVWMQKDGPTEKGDLKVKIVPGVGTTQEDIAELNGTQAQACFNECYNTVVENGAVVFSNIPYGNYSIRVVEDFDYQSSDPPMSASGEVSLNANPSYGDIIGLRGLGMSISLLKGDGSLIGLSEDVYAVQSCYVDYGTESCSVVNDPPYKLTLTENPLEMSGIFYSEEQVLDSENHSMKVQLMYNGETKWFSYGMKQGYAEYNWQFNTVGNPNGGIPESTARTAWKSAEPFAINDWAYSGDTLTLVIKNNAAETLQLMSVSVGGETYDSNISLAPGLVSTIDLVLGNCTQGQSYSVSKNTISFVYNSANISGKVQAGAADILGTCS